MLKFFLSLQPKEQRMKKISLLIQAEVSFSEKTLKQKLDSLALSSQVEPFIISYNATLPQSLYPVFTVDAHDDISLKQLLEAIPNDYFMFFSVEENYPKDFFERLLTEPQKAQEQVQRSVMEQSFVALQKSNYGLCGNSGPKVSEVERTLREHVVFNKNEVEKLNTAKMPVHQELAGELFRYAQKKNLSLLAYTVKKESPNYATSLNTLMARCQKQAQKEFKLFPALFVVFFLVFGLGAGLHPVFLLVFLVGMGAYMLAITLEAFGLSTVLKNGAIFPVLLVLFPFVHLVYGLESWIARFKK